MNPRSTPPPTSELQAPRHRGPSLARRALPALLLTGASGALLSALDRPGASVGATSGDATTATTTATATTAATAVATTAVATTEVATTVPATPVCTTYDGPTVDTRWGPVQVEASVTADGQICSVDAFQTPSDHRKSVSINDRAVPVLDARAVDAQSTGFDGVSGATITSNAYKQSLQAILDGIAAG